MNPHLIKAQQFMEVKSGDGLCFDHLLYLLRETGFHLHVRFIRGL